MRRKKRAINKQPTIKVGNISDVSGSVNIAGGHITTRQLKGLSATEIKQLFDQLYDAIKDRAETSSSDKEDLKAEVKEIQFALAKAAQNNEKVDEGFLSRHFRNIARVAPDALDVVVATLANPFAGLGIALKKIAEKAKEETTQK